MGDAWDKWWDFADPLGLFDSFTEKDTSKSPVAPVDETTPGSVATPTLADQAAQRRLARMSKYFTTPSGVLEEPVTGTTQGIFS